MSAVAIVDYGLSNLDSVARAVELCGGAPVFVENGAALAGHRAIILPGVGAFADGMAELHSRGLAEALREAVGGGAALLGICLGMQLLAGRGVEGGETAGLGLIAGSVERLVPGPGERVPHVGWNEVTPLRPSPLFAGIAPATDFYFVHSYRIQCDDPADVLAEAPYCGGFTACVQRGRVFGAQFHPEKSQRAGMAFLANLLSSV